MHIPTSSRARTKPAQRPHLFLVPPPSASTPAPRATVVQLAVARRDAQLAAVPAETACSTPSIARHLLTAIRAAMGLMFVACGLSGVFDFLPGHAGHVPGSAVALGGALVAAGSMIPLLKGVEVLLETVLETFQHRRDRESTPS